MLRAQCCKVSWDVLYDPPSGPDGPPRKSPDLSNLIVVRITNGRRWRTGDRFHRGCDRKIERVRDALGRPFAGVEKWINAVVHLRERNAIRVAPGVHQRPSLEKIDLSAGGNGRNSIHDVVGKWLLARAGWDVSFDDGPGQLQIHQHHVRGQRGEPGKPDGNRPLDVIEVIVDLAKHRVGTDLPNHQRWHLGNDVAFKTCQFLGRFLPTNAPIEDIDHATVKSAPQSEFEPM